MPSYFIDRRAQADGTHLVHERAKCPPDCFPAPGDAEYLGELLDGFQAVTLARLNYSHVNGCLWCATEVHDLGPEADPPWPVLSGASSQGASGSRLAPATLG